MTHRQKRLNSLLREVISDTIRKEVKHPDLSELFTVTDVSITSDLRYAKIKVSVIGTDLAKHQTLNALNEAKGFISFHASKQVVMRYFPELTFELDESVEKQLHIDELLQKIEKEKKARNDN
ncbi:MAG: Ribosome-binding factor A [Chlamydiae bacterium]|nr:Ribosome-binding factor A [Chlamydiota bacterium]